MAVDTFILPSRWLVFLPLFSVLTGGIMWLTEMQQLAHQNQIQIQELKSDIKKNRIRVYDKIATQEDRLGRIEGKIDILIHMIQEKENKK